MYRILCISVLVSFSASAPTNSEPVFPIPPIIQECGAKYNVGEDLQRSSFSEALFTDLETRCFITCVFIKMKMLKADGSLNAEALIDNVINEMPENLPKRDQIIEGYNSCAHKKGADICETAYKTAMCVHENKAINDWITHE